MSETCDGKQPELMQQWYAEATRLVDGYGTAMLHNDTDGAERAALLAPLSAHIPPGLLDRVKAAEQRVQDNLAPRRIPADPNGDVDLVLAEVRYWLEGKWPPFWLAEMQKAKP